jgi:shikimate dehydrogenase
MSAPVDAAGAGAEAAGSASAAGAARYAVIGHPIAHSKSPQIHAAFAAACGQNMQYQALLAPLDGFVACVQQFRAAGGRGANVTLPFKLEAYKLADELGNTLSERARAAGAVNTLRFDGEQILGDNTDGVGLVRDIVHNAGVALAGQRILLLGAGGAARGALLPLLEQGPQHIVIANRTPANADQLVQEFLARPAGNAATPAPTSAILTSCGFDALQDAQLGPFDLIINASSSSLHGSLPPLAPSLLAAHTLAYDMMYGAKPTVFLQWAAQHGARTRDGLGMLVEQAAASFYLWRGVYPATSQVYADLRAGLQ